MPSYRSANRQSKPTRYLLKKAASSQESSQTKSPQTRLIDPKGRMSVVRMGPHQAPIWRDPYHLLLTIPWISFLGMLSLLYIFTNALFALAYLLGGDGIENAHPGSFGDAFFFSVQTMASIGYGAMYPKTPYANVLVTIESLVGLLGLAMGTGLMFARFARPTARVLFSRVAVITTHDEQPVLMFRTANQRHNQILEAQMRLTLVRNEINREGQFMRRFYDLNLVRSHSPIFALTWTAMHPIDQSSPLYGMQPENFDEMEAELVVTLTGLDETFSQTIHARHSYIASEVLWNMKFADILSRLPDGRRAIDYSLFHEVMPR
jgi:inward rectifier potassium channel